tara:strand:+ start:61687 stop:61983 length:297 start_codon:yes stop_codon:yes gene_type:complete
MSDKVLKEYRNEILALWNVKTEESASVSAYLIYGKFLNFIDQKDFTGAKLAKQFLRMGKVSCRGWKNNGFKKYHSIACTDEKYLALKKNFFKHCKQVA